MIDPGERVLVAVSGGKDSLALWDILLDLGLPRRRALPRPRHRRVQRLVGRLRPGLRRARGRPDWSRSTCRTQFGFDIPTGAPGRPAGALLGVRAVEAPPLQPGGPRRRLPGDRHRAQPRRRGGGAVRQRPALGHGLSGPPAAGAAGQPRLRPQGQAARPPGRAGDGGVLRARGIDYIVEECPMAAGNKHLGYKDALNRDRGHLARDRRPPSTSASSTGSRRCFRPEAETEREGLHPCPGCGSPTTGELCAFCKLVSRRRAAPTARR